MYEALSDEVRTQVEVALFAFFSVLNTDIHPIVSVLNTDIHSSILSSSSSLSPRKQNVRPDLHRTIDTKKDRSRDQGNTSERHIQKTDGSMDDEEVITTVRKQKVYTRKQMTYR